MLPSPPDRLKPRKTPRQARSEATVDAVLEATIQVLRAHGAGRLTTTLVARRAGVSVGTMYQYFPHKQALLYAVVQRYLDEVASTVEATCRRHLGQPIEAASDAVVTAYIDAKGVDPEASRALYLASGDLEVSDLVNAAFERLRAATVELLESASDVRFADAEEVAFDLIATLTGATRVLFENGATAAMLRRFRQTMAIMVRASLHDAAKGPRGA